MKWKNIGAKVQRARLAKLLKLLITPLAICLCQAKKACDKVIGEHVVRLGLRQGIKIRAEIYNIHRF